jgi:chromosome partitioning protein
MAHGAGAGMTDGCIVKVDLEGVASRLVSRAISQADLVLTPMRATTLDATIGIRALALVQEEEEALGRPIRHAIVFSMTRTVNRRPKLTPFVTDCAGSP